MEYPSRTLLETWLWWGPGIGGLFPAFRRKNMLFPAFRGFFPDFPVSATFHCLFGLFRLSAASKRTFPVSAIFSNFSSFPWLKYGIFWFPATSFFRFSADFLWLFRFSGTFLVPFRLSAKSIPSPLDQLIILSAMVSTAHVDQGIIKNHMLNWSTLTKRKKIMINYMINHDQPWSISKSPRCVFSVNFTSVWHFLICHAPFQRNKLQVLSSAQNQAHFLPSE